MGDNYYRKVKEIDNHLNMVDGPAGLRLSKIYGINSVGIHKLSPNIFKYTNYIQLKKQKKIDLSPNKTIDIKKFNYTKIGYQYATAILIATTLAQSFNIDYLEKLGKLIGK